MKAAKKGISSRVTLQPVDPRFAPVIAAFRNHPDVSHGKMMSSMGLKINGKIFAMYGKNRFVVKVPKERVDELVEAGDGERFDPGHGRLMKEWIAFHQGETNWVELAHEAYEYVKSLG